jgi:hypothetical protein
MKFSVLEQTRAESDTMPPKFFPSKVETRRAYLSWGPLRKSAAFRAMRLLPSYQHQHLPLLPWPTLTLKLMSVIAPSE